MMTASLAHPRVRVAAASGGTIDLDDFDTQKLVLFVCPAQDREAAAREIADYESLLPDFCSAGAWVLGIADATADTPAYPSHMRLGIDPDGRALATLAAWAGIAADPARGATLVLERNGAVRAAWDSCGHARDALLSVRDGS